jgi:transcriptional regulator with XRE-family HTH domain
MEQVGQNVRRLRLEKEWTHAKLARRAKMHHMSVVQIERGRSCSLAVLGRLAKALGVEPWQLLKPSDD